MARTLLVPGTQATQLIDQTGKTVFNAVRAALHLSNIDLGGRSPEEVGQLLSMEHAPGELPPRRTTLEAGTEVRTGPVLETPYAGLPVTDRYRYDWRADLRFNARLLLRFLQDRAPAPNDRWNLIGHSQGGLLIVLAAKLAGDPAEFARLVGKVVLIGTPLAGTMRAAEALLFGRDDLGQQNAAAIRTAARTWPALYQMLPSWAAELDANGQPLAPDQQFTVPGGWPGLTGTPGGLDADCLLRARETQLLLSGPFSHFAPSVDVFVLFGNKQMTPVSVGRTGANFSSTFKNAKGDTLVPAKTTLDALGPPFHERRQLLSGDVESHSLLCIDEDLQKRVKAFLALPPL